MRSLSLETADELEFLMTPQVAIAIPQEPTTKGCDP